MRRCHFLRIGVFCWKREQKAIWGSCFCSRMTGGYPSWTSAWAAQIIIVTTAHLLHCFLFLNKHTQILSALGHGPGLQLGQRFSFSNQCIHSLCFRKFHVEHVTLMLTYIKHRLKWLISGDSPLAKVHRWKRCPGVWCIMLGFGVTRCTRHQHNVLFDLSYEACYGAHYINSFKRLITAHLMGKGWKQKTTENLIDLLAFSLLRFPNCISALSYLLIFLLGRYIQIQSFLEAKLVYSTFHWLGFWMFCSYARPASMRFMQCWEEVLEIASVCLSQLVCK